MNFMPFQKFGTAVNPLFRAIKSKRMLQMLLHYKASEIGVTNLYCTPL